MIEKMKKIYIAVKRQDEEGIVRKIYDAGALHVKAAGDLNLAPDPEELALYNHAKNALKFIPKSALIQRFDQEDDFIDQILGVANRIMKKRSVIESLRGQLKKQELWGDVTLDKLEGLDNAEVALHFYSARLDDLDDFEAALVQVVNRGDSGKHVIAVVDPKKIPDSAVEIHRPLEDSPTLRQRVVNAEQRIAQLQHQMEDFAVYRDWLKREVRELETRIEFSGVANGSHKDESFFTLQGWVPVSKVSELTEVLQKGHLAGAWCFKDPEDGETPPTNIIYPAWAKPIKGLFDVLGTFPGYKEKDLAPFFMIFLPLFAAILIGDAGYGLVFLLPALAFQKTLIRTMGKAKTQLFTVMGAVMFIYGVLAANYFGITPDTLASAGGFIKGELPDMEAMLAGSGGYAFIGRLMVSLGLLWDIDSEVAREILIKLSFSLGCLHMVLGHLKQLVCYYPDSRALAQVGWCVFIVSMFGVVWILFFGLETLPVPLNLVLWGLGIGAVLSVFFANKEKNIFKRIGLGVASSLLDWLGSFSDLMSYIRLMAVGMASYYIALATNQLATDAASGYTWIAGGIVLILGHGLNVLLGMIAIFAHGVRLNMLEFSNNAGVQWEGYEYEPFSDSALKEE